MALWSVVVCTLRANQGADLSFRFGSGGDVGIAIWKRRVHIRELDAKQSSVSTAAACSFNFVLDILWACTFGWVLFLGYLIAGIINCIFRTTIALALHSLKLAGLLFWPVEYRVVPIALAKEARQRNTQQQLDKRRGTTVAMQ